MAKSENNLEYNDMQRVKRRFFAMRNGVIADVLRRGGSPFRIIFGLNLPQIVEIAADFTPDPELGRTLWENNSTRESMLIAPMLMDPATFPYNVAMEWIDQVATIEVADILCHRLLRKTTYAVEMASELAASEREMHRYIALRLMFNLVGSYPEKAREIALNVSSASSPLTDSVSSALLEEVEYLLNQ